MRPRVVYSACRLTILLALFLGGCFTSDEPLLTIDDAVTPFPDNYITVETDGNGSIKVNDKGEANVSEIVRKGKVYLKGMGDPPITLTFAELDRNSGTYLLQEVMQASDPKSGKVQYNIDYVVVKYLDDTILKYSPPDPNKTGLDAALRKAGIVYAEKGSNFSFSDKAQLFAAARLYASRLVDGSITRYRVASSAESLAALRKDIEQAQSGAKQKIAAAGSPGRPATTAAPPPPPAPSIPARDQGAAAVDPCDQQAAHPNDPGRMAPGLKLEAIVPALALRECERAVAQFPNTARFRYQFGRAQEASGNAAAAVAGYQQAAAMGHGMAWYNLGLAYANGTGVPADARAAETYLRKAIAAGIDASTQLAAIVFVADGYSSPQFFSAIFEGRLHDFDAKAVSVYLGEFMQLFHNTPDCQHVVSVYAMSRLLQSETISAFGQMLSSLANSGRDYRPGDLAGAAQSGWNAGMTSTNGLMLQVSKAQTDAQLFYDRHGCHSPVSRQFFGNVETLAKGL